MSTRLKVAILTTDARECWREYQKPEPYFGSSPGALLEAMPDCSKLEVHVISCWQKPLPAPEKLAHNIWFHGLVVPKIGWLRTGYQGCIRAVRRKLHELQPHIVHGQGTERDCAISAALSGFPNVVTIHGNMNAISRSLRAPIGSFMWFAARIENFTLKRTLGVVCNSAHTEQLVKHRTPRTWRVPNPVRKEFFAPLPPASRGPCTLLNVGVVTELKRQLELLILAQEWHNRGLQFHLQFIGRADETSAYTREFLRQIRLAEKAGYASYLGLKSAPELVAIFDQAHAIIHIPQEEAFGLVVAEGLARNLKLFAFSVGGIVDIAADVDGAELIRPDDWRALGTAVERWIAADLPRPRLAAATMRERYHPSVIVNKHLAIYDEALRSCS